MRLTHIVTSAALVALLCLAPGSTLSAQHRGGSHGSSGSRSSGGHVSGAQPRGGAPPPQGGVHAVPRGSVPPYGGGGDHRGVDYRGGYYRGGYYRGGYYNGYRPYYQPYYGRYPYYGGFYPRYSLGFGLWAGYPYTSFSFGYGYPYPYAYAYPSYGYPSPYSYAYPYPAPYAAAPYGYQQQQSPAQQDCYTTSPNVTPTGGVSFEITPNTAEVYVDGAYVGTAGQFAPTSQPLTMSPGRHHVEIRAPGYAGMVFDADVAAGQIVPYRGAMQAR